MKINLAGIQITSEYQSVERELVELRAKISAIDKAQAVIEFDLNGTILTANSNFLNLMDYRLDEIQGKHHSIFVEPGVKGSNEYRQFWDKLNRGEYDVGEYKRLGNNGKEVWIQASYSPVFDQHGNPRKVIKFATDVSANKMANADYQGQIAAIDKAQAVIEFNMDGTIITANDNFLSTIGYRLDEIQGKHHSLFVAPEFAVGDEYRQFWESLQRGEYQVAEYQRIGKGGKAIWLQASYNPIMDLNGKPVKVVKFATDITAQKNQAVENKKIADVSSALKLCNANVMLADNDLTIVYMNNGIEKLFRDYQPTLRQSLTDFNPDTLLGSSTDIFRQDQNTPPAIVGGLDQTSVSRFEIAGLSFNLTISPWLDNDNVRLGMVIEWHDLTAELATRKKEKKLADANARIKSALDRCQTNVMMADIDLNIIYINDSVQQMMQRNESSLRQALPNFNAAKLMGTCIDDFYKDPAGQRSMLATLTQVYKTKILLAGLTFELIATPIFDDDGERLGTVVEWNDLTEILAEQIKERTLATANARVKTALDKCQANVMLADNELNIIYVNDSVEAMMRGNEAELRSALPNFAADQLVGTCVDDFHANPGHQRALLSRLTTSYSTKFQIGKLTFTLVSTPIYDNDERLGTVVEWEDITEELATQAAADALASDNARIKTALDKCQANVMMADLDLNIIYINDSARAMMQGNEAKLRSALPNFNVSKLIGTCIDDFHKNPGHQRNLLGNFNEVYKTRINIGGLTFRLVATPVFDEEGTRLGSIVEWNDLTEELAARDKELALSAANARVKIALDKCQANVMMADLDLNIIYINDSAEAMMQGNEATIRKALPSFTVSKLVGTCIDDFHVNPAHQRSLLGSLNEVYSTRLLLAGLTFNLVATPVFDEEGTRLGSIVEWNDMTEELAAREKEQTLAAANARVKVALDKCQANVMMADLDLNIIYLNESVKAMMQSNEATIRKALPSFTVSKLVGTCIDDFHVNPAHQRSLLGTLDKVYQTRLSLAGLTFNLIATPVFDEDGTRLGSIVEWNDLTEELAAQLKERQIADENARIRQALDCVGTNTMIANADNDIIYTNRAVNTMMLAAEKDVQLVMPHFNAANLVGQSVDMFHKNPAHQQNMLARLESTHSTEITVGKRTFLLIANPIKSDSGERIGTVVEWSDRTEEVAIEQEVAKLIGAAGAGDLSQRIEESGKSGFFLSLTAGLNQLVGIAEGVINETAKVLDAMAHGDLTQRIDTDYQGAFNKLKTDANGTAEKLTEIIGRINNSSAAVASGAEEIAQGNTDLSQRTEEQASSLEETASSMEQMTATVRQNAENAKVANDLAADATTKAEKGGEVVKRAVTSMAEINDSSKKIADIIGVIDEIAFQTNLLALNAAVEAARAGEQGRGFAVVAGEVRNLAQRSAAAAKEIKDLIRDSVSKVQDGSQLVNESGVTLNEIVGAISRVTSMIGEISLASSEQSEGIEQVNRAITQMDEMTQQNAALVEEASAAGEAMADQARGMRQILGFFTTDDNALAVVEPSTPVRSPTAKRKAAIPAVAVPPTPLPSGLDFAGDDGEEWEEF